jgi:hypothetical protein
MKPIHVIDRHPMPGRRRLMDRCAATKNWAQT